MYLEDMTRGVDRINVARDTDQWRDLVNTRLCVPQNAGNFLAN